MDIPDRLPYEVMHRLYADVGPSIQREHNFRQAALVVSSKKSGTIRPFVRVHPLDLIVYQALVDQLAATIEGALPPSDRVGAYRQSLDPLNDNPFEGSPRNDQFQAEVSDAIEQAGSVFVLQTDISGYFLGISHLRMCADLWEVTDRPEVVSDLREVLSAWQKLGIRGLPQGLRPSSPLANFYLGSLDRALGSEVPFYRWADDMWAICPSFAQARRIQDQIERHLYAMGLTLNGEKTRILRAETALNMLEPAKARFEAKTEALLEDFFDGQDQGPYSVELEPPDPSEVERDVVISEMDRLTSALSDTDLPEDFHSDARQALSKLEAIGDAYAVDTIPQLLQRAPDLTDQALRYVVAAAKSIPKRAAAVFTALLSKEHAGRDHERLVACHRALSLPKKSASLAKPLGSLASRDTHALVRAKALVAWGRHSKPDEFDVVDRFLASAEPEWRTYAFVAIQRKDKVGRTSRMKKWGGGGGELGAVADQLGSNPIKWTRL